jgi:hypothetical protein
MLINYTAIQKQVLNIQHLDKVLMKYFFHAYGFCHTYIKLLMFQKA